MSQPQIVSRSADELERRQRTARRGLVTAVAVPVVLAVVLGGVAFGYYAVVGYRSVLDPADYQSLRVGQPMREVEQVLPPMERFDPPERAQTPPGATCRYYRTAGPFSSADTFQLCFAGDRLVAKQLITGRPPQDGETPS